MPAKYIQYWKEKIRSQSRSRFTGVFADGLSVRFGLESPFGIPNLRSDSTFCDVPISIFYHCNVHIHHLQFVVITSSKRMRMRTCEGFKGNFPVRKRWATSFWMQSRDTSMSLLDRDSHACLNGKKKRSAEVIGCLRAYTTTRNTVAATLTWTAELLECNKIIQCMKSTARNIKCKAPKAFWLKKGDDRMLQALQLCTWCQCTEVAVGRQQIFALFDFLVCPTNELLGHILRHKYK